MKKLIVTLIFMLGSANLFADSQCDTTNIALKDKYESKLLKVEIKGSCTITADGDLEKLKAFLISNMIDAPEVREVHSVDNTDTYTEIDSTIFISTSNGELEARFLTRVGLENDKLYSNKESKVMIRATGNSKRLKKLTEVINVTKIVGGFKVDIASGTHIKLPKMFRSMAIKGIKKSFPEMLKGISQEIADNL